MLNNKILSEISNNKNFKIVVNEPFNKLSIEFLNNFSNELKKHKKIYSYPDLIYLFLWCNKKKIENLARNFKLKNNEMRLGRGLIFHICPSNVPTNFIYSFFFGLLSGNSNIIKVPSKNFPEKDIIIKIVKKLFNKNKFIKLRNSNDFIQYENHNINTEKISSICDGRVIWGGDKTINLIRKIWIPERSIDITFPDRYSLSIINMDHFSKINNNEIKLLARKFYYDGYSMNQAACNSPHFIFWIGAKNFKKQNYFWNQLNKIVEKKFLFDDMHIIDKYSNLIENIITHNDFDKLKMFKNRLYVLNPSKKIKKIENIRGVNGTFFQKNIDEIKNLKNYISKKCQTVTYFGFDKEKLKKFTLNNNLQGIDRLVPIGKALEINIIWDGYEVVNSLSRVISLE